jgi:hypothetical protein
VSTRRVAALVRLLGVQLTLGVSPHAGYRSSDSSRAAVLLVLDVDRDSC